MERRAPTLRAVTEPREDPPRPPWGRLGCSSLKGGEVTLVLCWGYLLEFYPLERSRNLPPRESLKGGVLTRGTLLQNCLGQGEVLEKPSHHGVLLAITPCGGRPAAAPGSSGSRRVSSPAPGRRTLPPACGVSSVSCPDKA